MTLVEQLKDIYQNNHQLVIFAESKNAGLIAFNYAVIIGMALLLDKDLGSFPNWILVYIMILNAISALISISSLVAQKQAKEKKTITTENENLLFFGTIAHLDPEEYLEKITTKYQLKSDNYPLEYDLARQVIIITQIANRKFTRFNYALACTIMSIITPVGYLIYYLSLHPNR